MIHINSEQAMKAFGCKVGAALAGGELIELVGDVGAGKTTFVKGLAVGMGIDEDIQSPSFTINRTYETPGGLTLSHYDFYRLHEPGILADELDEVAHATTTAVVIEWADIVQDVLPSDRLTMQIIADGEMSRTVSLRAHGARAHKLLEAVR